MQDTASSQATSGHALTCFYPLDVSDPTRSGTTCACSMQCWNDDENDGARQVLPFHSLHDRVIPSACIAAGRRFLRRLAERRDRSDGCDCQ